jgi:hypothetical protein
MRLNSCVCAESGLACGVVDVVDVDADVVLAQGILQDADLKAWWAYCQQYPLHADTTAAAAAAAAECTGGEAVPMTHPVSIPLTALAHSKHLVNWIKQRQQQQQQEQEQGGVGASSSVLDVSDIPQLMLHIQELLHQAAAEGQLPEGGWASCLTILYTMHA